MHGSINRQVASYIMLVLTFFVIVTCVLVLTKVGGGEGSFILAGHQRYFSSITEAEMGSPTMLRHSKVSFSSVVTEIF